jgi:hypothetical protein
VSTDQAARDGLSAATTLGNVSTTALIAGGVLAATGVVLMLIPSSNDQKASALNAVVRPGYIGIQGSF